MTKVCTSCCLPAGMGRTLQRRTLLDRCALGRYIIGLMPCHGEQCGNAIRQKALVRAALCLEGGGGGRHSCHMLSIRFKGAARQQQPNGILYSSSLCSPLPDLLLHTGVRGICWDGTCPNDKDANGIGVASCIRSVNNVHRNHYILSLLHLSAKVLQTASPWNEQLHCQQY